MQRAMIESFMKTGISTHSYRAQTLHILIDHCMRNGLDFTLLVAHDSMIVIKKGIVSCVDA
jgi:hypothetical protein